jgi:hypothetical protein
LVGWLVSWLVHCQAAAAVTAAKLPPLPVGRSVNQSVGRLVGRSVGWLVGQSVGRWVGWSVSQKLVGWSVGCLVGWSVGWLVGRLVVRSVGWPVTPDVGRSVSRSVGRSVGQSGWSVGLVSMSAGQLSEGPHSKDLVHSLKNKIWLARKNLPM